MNKKMRLWVAGTVGVLMTGLMSVNAYALEEKDVIGTWYVNELSMGGDILFHPGVMGMEVTVDIKRRRSDGNHNVLQWGRTRGRSIRVENRK